VLGKKRNGNSTRMKYRREGSDMYDDALIPVVPIWPARSPVFCGECRYFKLRKRYQGAFCHDEYCDAPENIEDTYKERNGGKIKTPSEQNRSNNCPWYEGKK